MFLLKKHIFFAVVFFFFTAAFVFAHEWMAPKQAAKVKNPVARNEQSVLLGKAVYNDFCIHCHGAEAKGKDAKNAGLNQSPPNLQKTLKAHSDGGFFWKIRNGRKEMPSFKEDLKEREVWSVIHYIRSLIKN